MNAFTRAFIHFVLNQPLVILRDGCLVYLTALDVGFRGIIVIHLKIAGQAIGALIAGGAIFLLNKRNPLHAPEF